MAMQVAAADLKVVLQTADVCLHAGREASQQGQCLHLT